MQVAPGGDREDLQIVCHRRIVIDTAASSLPHGGIDGICNDS
jgi:hypothetical protein